MPTTGQRELHQAVTNIGISPERFAGGHCSVGAYREVSGKVSAEK